MKTSPLPVALVTGAARGIGAGVARRLAADGYLVVINSVSANPDDPGRPASRLKADIEREGGRADIFRADVADADDRAAMIEHIDATHGRLDLLVNNAGVAPLERADLLEATEESFDRLVAINLRGPYFLTQLAARRMIDYKARGIAPTPRIAFVTSISAYATSTNRGDYCVSKAGLSMAAALYADRLAEHGIPVVEIRPGIILTDMTGPVKEKYDRLIADGLLPTRRWGDPVDVARAVSAFARGDLDYSTGQVIETGGGFSLRRL